MAATTDAEVFNFEGNLEESFYDYLLANGIEIATGNDPQKLGDDYVSVQVTIGGIFSDEHMRAKPDGKLEYDHYNYSVSITVHTDRNENAVPGTAFARYHRELVAKVRNLLSISRAYAAASLNDQITLYDLNRLMASGTDYSSDDNSYDETILSFEGDFSILTTAWPVS
jgi:hypothetical protein